MPPVVTAAALDGPAGARCDARHAAAHLVPRTTSDHRSVDTARLRVRLPCALGPRGAIYEKTKQLVQAIGAEERKHARVHHASQNPQTDAKTRDYR